MHSPMKNQQNTSTPTTVLSTAWLTVHDLKDCFWALAILVDRSAMATGMSAGEGGASSTLAYFQKVSSLGVATSLVVATRAGSFWISLAIMIESRSFSFRICNTS